MSIKLLIPLYPFILLWAYSIMLLMFKRNKNDILKASENFARLWRSTRPTIDQLSTLLPDPNFKPNLEELYELNALCEMNLDRTLRQTLIIVMNAFQSASLNFSLGNFGTLDKYLDAYDITNRMVYFPEENELHLTVVSKRTSSAFMLVQFKEDVKGVTFYYDNIEGKKGAAIILQ